MDLKFRKIFRYPLIGSLRLAFETCYWMPAIDLLQVMLTLYYLPVEMICWCLANSAGFRRSRINASNLIRQKKNQESMCYFFLFHSRLLQLNATLIKNEITLQGKNLNINIQLTGTFQKTVREKILHPVIMTITKIIRLCPKCH